MIFWPWFAGLLTLVCALFAARKSFLSAKGLEKLIEFGPIFFAVPLVTFGAEHLTSAEGISQVVPSWMPAHMFWTYFVGIALICAGITIALRLTQARIAAMLLGIMFVCFVLMIHIPNAVANPHNRIIWAVAFRDLSFAGGAFALAARMRPLRIAARVLVAVPLVFFAVEHFLHPEFAPGVPLAKVTPDWVPMRAFWGYLTGAALLISGATMLVDLRRARVATTLLGALITLLVLFLYLPIFLTAAQPALLEGINYVADTLLFAGIVLLAAAIMPGGVAQTAVSRAEIPATPSPAR